MKFTSSDVIFLKLPEKKKKKHKVSQIKKFPKINVFANKS